MCRHPNFASRSRSWAGKGVEIKLRPPSGASYSKRSPPQVHVLQIDLSNRVDRFVGGFLVGDARLFVSGTAASAAEAGRR